MENRITDSEQTIDRTTSVSICTAIGERLRRNLASENAEMPSRLQLLLEQMQRQDEANAAGA
jgi:hypothetical protein